MPRWQKSTELTARLPGSRRNGWTSSQRWKSSPWSTCKIENPLQREKMISLESAATEAVNDAVSVRQAIEVGVSSDIPIQSSSRKRGDESPQAEQEMKALSVVSKPGKSCSRCGPGAIDTYSVAVTHRSDGLKRAHCRDLGQGSLLSSGEHTVHLQQDDGKIIQVPVVKFSDRDVTFLARGR